MQWLLVEIGAIIGLGAFFLGFLLWNNLREIRAARKELEQRTAEAYERNVIASERMCRLLRRPGKRLNL